MDSFDAYTILQNRMTSPATADHNHEGCCCTGPGVFGKGDAASDPAKEDKAHIISHPDLLALSGSKLLQEFQGLQEDRVRVYGLFERFYPRHSQSREPFSEPQCNL